MNSFSTSELVKELKKFKFPYSTESECQEAIHKALPFLERHKRLSQNDIPDFMFEKIAIEVKIKGSPISIYKQCERYLKSSLVDSLILVTGKTMGLPEKINGKPVFVIFLGCGWL